MNETEFLQLIFFFTFKIDVDEVAFFPIFSKQWENSFQFIVLLIRFCYFDVCQCIENEIRSFQYKNKIQMVSSVHNWTGPSNLDVFQLSNSEEIFFFIDFNIRQTNPWSLSFIMNWPLQLWIKEYRNETKKNEKNTPLNRRQ